MTDHFKTTDNLPASVSAESKTRIHQKLKSLVEQELSRESATLGGKPGTTHAVHGSIEWRPAGSQKSPVE
jgi:hypothetical protein